MNDYRIIGIVEIANVAAIEAQVVAILGEQYVGILVTKARRASPTGQEPATHVLTSQQMPADVAQAFVAMLDPTAGIDGYRSRAIGVDPPGVPEVLDASKLPPGDPAEWRWTPDAVLQKLGLHWIIPPTGGPHP